MAKTSFLKITIRSDPRVRMEFADVLKVQSICVCVHVRSTSVAGVSAVHISLKPVSFPVTQKASQLPLSILVKDIINMVKAPARPAGFLHVDALLHMPEHPRWHLSSEGHTSGCVDWHWAPTVGQKWTETSAGGRGGVIISWSAVTSDQWFHHMDEICCIWMATPAFPVHRGLVRQASAANLGSGVSITTRWSIHCRWYQV